METKIKKPSGQGTAQENTRVDYNTFGLILDQLHKDKSLPLARGRALEYTLSNDTKKRYPPYGKELNALRLSGRIPQLRIMVTTDWRLCEWYPRIIIQKNVRVENLVFDYLTGLSVQIVHHDGEEELVDALIDAILKVNPKTLVSFNIDIRTLTWLSMLLSLA